MQAFLSHRTTFKEKQDENKQNKDKLQMCLVNSKERRYNSRSVQGQKSRLNMYNFGSLPSSITLTTILIN